MPYTTCEQLHALCVLMCWVDGVSLPNGFGGNKVNLLSRPKGNTGFAVYMLESNPHVTDVFLEDVPSLPYSPILFKVLGIQLQVVFDEDGVGQVSFPGDSKPRWV